MISWYVVKTKPKKEDIVAGLLAKASYEVFSPKMRRLFAAVPLFPSYLFVRTNLTDAQHRRMIHFTRGVSKILGDEEGPLSISDEVITTLQQKTRDGSLIEQSLLFHEGEMVRIKKGVLKDLTGIINKNISATGRVEVLFRWLNNSVRARVKYTDLEKAA